MNQEDLLDWAFPSWSLKTNFTADSAQNPRQTEVGGRHQPSPFAADSISQFNKNQTELFSRNLFFQSNG